MGRVSVRSLREGMVLEAPLKTPEGRAILAQGTVLTDKHIRMLKIWGVTDAEVEGFEDESLQAEEALKSEQLARAASLVGRWMPPPGEDPFLQEVARIGAEEVALRLLKEGNIPVSWVPRAPEGPPAPPDPRGKDLGPGGMAHLVRHQVKLVSFPAIYFKIREVIDSPVSSATHIADVVSKDPSLTVRLLRLVNSSFYGFPQRIDSIPRAVAIIGTNQLTALALAVSAVKVFKGVPARYVDMEAFWEHSVACGVLARVIAFALRLPNEERFFVAGLLHDIGRLILFHKIPWIMTEALETALREARPLFEVETRMLGFHHAALGERLMREWNIPEPIRALVGAHHEPSEGDHPVEGAVVHLADLLAGVLRWGTSGSAYVPPADRGVLQTLGLPPEALESVVAQAKRQVAEIRRAFLL